MLNYLLNCFILFIPVFLWDLLLYKKLPSLYQPQKWDRIPKALDIAENVFRFLTFFVPLNMKLEIRTQNQIAGLVLYCIGLAVYGFSWIIQIFHTRIAWSGHPALITAPAYTAVVWLLGIFLMGTHTFIEIPHGHSMYLSIILIFGALHTGHAFLVVKKERLARFYK